MKYIHLHLSCFIYFSFFSLCVLFLKTKIVCNVSFTKIKTLINSLKNISIDTFAVTNQLFLFELYAFVVRFKIVWIVISRRIMKLINFLISLNQFELNEVMSQCICVCVYNHICWHESHVWFHLHNVLSYSNYHLRCSCLRLMLAFKPGAGGLCFIGFGRFKQWIYAKVHSYISCF